MLMGGKAAASGPTAPGVESAWRNTRRIAGQTSLERKKGVLMLLTLVSFAGIAAGALASAQVSPPTCCAAAPGEALRAQPLVLDGRDADGDYLLTASAGYDLNAGPLLATRKPYPAAVADDVRRPGFGGAHWQSRSIIGPGAGPYMSDFASPGPEAYGAYGLEDAVAYARVGGYVVPISPWERVESDAWFGARRETADRLEAARTEWLKERGYVGGIRTFTNDAPKKESAGEIKPRGVIELAPDVPTIQPRQEVKAEPLAPPPGVTPAQAREALARASNRAPQGEARMVMPAIAGNVRREATDAPAAPTTGPAFKVATAEEKPAASGS